MLFLKFFDSLGKSWGHHVDVFQNNEKIMTLDMYNMFRNRRSYQKTKDEIRENIRDMEDGYKEQQQSY